MYQSADSSLTYSLLRRPPSSLCKQLFYLQFYGCPAAAHAAWHSTCTDFTDRRKRVLIRDPARVVEDCEYIHGRCHRTLAQ